MTQNQEHGIWSLEVLFSFHKLENLRSKYDFSSEVSG